MELFKLLRLLYLKLKVMTEAYDLDLFIYFCANMENIDLLGTYGEPIDNFCRGYFYLLYQDKVKKESRRKRF